MIVVLVSTDEDLPSARESLRELGVTGSEVVAPGDRRRLLVAPVIDESQGPQVIARLRSEGRTVVLRPSGGPQLGAWTRHTRPVLVGDRLAVCFAWSEHDRHGVAGLVEIDPDGGFGTGHHPSTRLLIEELASRITGGERVLDVGCGSGVLGLCALRLGASSLLGVDVEAPAIEATRRNAALNGFELQVDTTHATLDQIEGAFDVVVANIGRAAFVELAPHLRARVSSGGWLGVSGMALAQCSLVEALLHPMQLVESRTRDEWPSLVFAHTPSGHQPESQ